MTHAQLILKSGKITTLNPAQPEVQAVAIAAGIGAVVASLVLLAAGGRRRDD